MRHVVESAKRWLFGAPIRTDAAHVPAFRSRIAVGVFGASILSAAIYAPNAVVDALARAGQLDAIPALVGVVVAVMVVLALAYRSNLAYRPDDRADYGLVKDVLGPRPAALTGAALLVDYIFTVTVSAAALAHLLVALMPQWVGAQRWVAAGVIALMTLATLRGVRDRARVLVAVWAAFALVIVALGIVGALRLGGIELPVSTPEVPGTWTIIAALAAAAASGAVMVTGMEHLASAAPWHAQPAARRAGRTLMIATLAAATAFAVIMVLAWAYRVTGDATDPVLIRVADRFLRTDVAVWAVAIAAMAILYAAAAAVFSRFSHLAAVLAADGLLPRQLAMRNDRMVFRGGVVTVSTIAIAAAVISGAHVVHLVHMYVVGVFTAMTLSQIAMVRALMRDARLATSGPQRRALRARTGLHLVAAVITVAVLGVVAVVNFSYGAWVAVVMMVGLVVVMHAISRHYARVRADLTIAPGDRTGALPAATHGIVLVAQLHRPAMRALAYAKAARHTSLHAVTVQIDPDASRALHDQWTRASVGVPLVMLDSPYRDIVSPVLNYVHDLHRSSPRDVVVVYVPEYIVGTWWERLLHNRATVRLRSQLLREESVVVAAVPWHVSTSHHQEDWRDA